MTRRITNNQGTVVINFHQDFVASMHSDFLQGQADIDLFYLHNHSRVTRLSKQVLDLEDG
jgi:hypothetical protein